MFNMVLKYIKINGLNSYSLDGGATYNVVQSVHLWQFYIFYIVSQEVLAYRRKWGLAVCLLLF